MTHIPAFAETITRNPSDFGLQVGNAYFYNLTLGQKIMRSAKVTRVVSGHTHVGVKVQVRGKVRAIEVQVLNADYGRPDFAVFDYPE